MKERDGAEENANKLWMVFINIERNGAVLSWCPSMIGEYPQHRDMNVGGEEIDARKVKTKEGIQWQKKVKEREGRAVERRGCSSSYFDR